MRILLDYRPALRRRTGVGEYVHELARALVATAPANESVTLFSASWNDRLHNGVPGARIVDRRIPVRLLNLAWHRLEWPAAERLARSPFDVVQAAHPLLIPTARAAQIVTVHDLDFLDHPERTSAEIRRDYPALAAAHAARADRILAVSRHTAADLERRFGVSPSNISICSPGAPDWPPRAMEPADGCVLFLGTLEPRKNLGRLLDAYERVLAAGRPAPTLVLAGGPTPEAAPLVERARRAPLAGHVELPGYIDPERRRSLYERALMFVMPSHAEGFGMPVLEAMTVGVPVVAANRGALPEVAGSAAQLVDPDDAEAIAAAMTRVLQDAALRAHMRDAGWRQARQFTWRTTAHRVRDAWQLACERRRERRG